MSLCIPCNILTRHKRKKKKKKKSKSNELPCDRPEIRIKLSSKDRQSAIAGYCLKMKKYCPSDITALIDTFYNDMTYQYTLSNENCTKQFLQSPKGHKLSSDTFDINLNNHMFTFQLVVYPNGCINNSSGSVDLMIKCLTDIKQYNINTLTLYLILYCPETENEMRDFIVRKDDIQTWKWPSYSMKLSECYKYSEVTFKCYIDLLRIEYEAENNRFDNKDMNVMNSNVEYKWKINNRFRIMWGQIYYSNNFNSNYWTVLCFPVGESYFERGNCKLCLRLLRMPYNVNYMECKYTLEIKGFEKYGTTQTNIFRMNSGDKCNNYHLVFDHEHSVLLNQMSVWSATVTIQVMKLYDFNDKPISPHKWSEHNVLYQCDTIKL